ncbi:curli production assembly/transport protein CsgE [Paenalcaligenes niemegkensis]|uniref:curli production assembly/transport protein CsgE n=1 Tax=Paenalcaligenes niemegkensis TaxID=2895469 RepID=UPI001EE900EE|nr:curli production assembly/transport protein CsgE [Paenalcaligenes niemegkensis]MCQ9616449.1 curli production assembly/transport protein CsgE [Paenalcaligenes niemegkensis]
MYERPSARWGSEIWVEYRRQEMFHTFLPPARSQTRPISEYAVNLVFENLMDSEQERLLTHNPDLAPEEF